MKNHLLSIILIFSFAMAHSQIDFGIKGGLNFSFFKVVEADFGANPETETGYFGGVYLDFKIDKGLHIQPELLYKGIGDFNFLNAPIYFKYDIDNNFHLLIGPSLNYFFDFIINSFKVRADVSIEYDIVSRFNVNMKYTLGFEELAPNVIFLGVGYKL